MLDLALVRAEAARVKAALKRRGRGPEAVDRVVDLDGRWAARQDVAEALRLRRRRISEEIASRRRAGTGAEDLENLGRQVADDLRRVERELADLDAARREALLAIPNLPATDVPDESAAPAEGPPWPHAFPPLPHWDLLQALGLVHPGGGPGRGFLVWRGAGARLVRALAALMIDLHTRQHGYEEVLCPSVATEDQLTGSAHLPTLRDKMYELASPLYLAPRAEPHLAGLYAGQVLPAARLPIRLVAAGTAFRRELGGHGRQARGLLRLHEFPTVELYAFCRPEESDAELERAVGAAEAVLERLEVPHRRRPRPAAGLSHAAARTADVEVWAPGMGAWLQVAAISSFTDYQARRTQTRLREADGRARLVHTVGGAAVALPRLVAALLENNQQADGSVRLPPALHARLGRTALGGGT